MYHLTNFKLVILGMLLASSAVLHAAESSKTVELHTKPDNNLIVIQNIAGKITLSPSSDSMIHITGTAKAQAKNQKKADELLESIGFDEEKFDDKTVISVSYPLDDYTGIIYNPDDKASSWNWGGQSSSKYMGQKVRVARKAKGVFSKWAEVHADLNIAIPAGQKSKVRVISGQIDANNINNDLSLDSSSGKINVNDSRGRLSADTGSGKITIENFTGDIDADTGSGSIVLTNINGSADADTGSGSIKINKVTGNVKADTGSGSVTVNDYLGGELIEIDTGSGGVRINGDLGNVNNLEIDTGSGSVKIVSTHAPSLKIDIDTGSGGIHVDLPDLQVKRDKRGTFIGTVGDGKGRASIDTGSGSVSFKMDDSYESVAKPVSGNDKSKSDRAKNTGKPNPELATKVQAALNKDEDIRNANLEVSAVGSRAIIAGSMDSVWDIAKAVKIVNDVEGVDNVSVDLELNED
ncbi:MAG: DUF4097 family beta strand repeat protein [Gammaproteobacteria bacterium]|nr:DUF4097 family beta strand repeat protein [Gammaproteobacteria bacterium]NNM14291.1 DUF4097 family beta strand repeat protein [Gammaproteobacteria bacterium]